MKLLVKDNLEMSREAIRLCSTPHHVKCAEKIIERCNLDPYAFPRVISVLKRNSMYYFLKGTDIDLFELIGLVEDDMECLGMLIEHFQNQSKAYEDYRLNTVGLGELAAHLLRSNPRVKPYIRPHIAKKLEAIPPSTKALRLDSFGPIGTDHLTLPLLRSAVKVINCPEQVAQLEWTSQVYGLDCEWRPNLMKYQTYPVSIMTIASETVRIRQEVYIIDVLTLKDCQLLDVKLLALFSSPSIVKIGMCFQGDLKALQASLPDFKAFKVAFCAYVDLLEGYKAAFDNKSPGGLAGMCNTLLGRPLCKVKQTSNWSNRPLQLAQLHYAALDAHVQIQLWQEIEQLIRVQGGNPAEQLVTLDLTQATAPAKAKKCRNCGEKGHIAKKCLKGPKCKQCSEFGHTARLCKKAS